VASGSSSLEAGAAGAGESADDADAGNWGSAAEGAAACGETAGENGGGVDGPEEAAGENGGGAGSTDGEESAGEGAENGGVAGPGGEEPSVAADAASGEESEEPANEEGGGPSADCGDAKAPPCDAGSPMKSAPPSDSGEGVCVAQGAGGGAGSGTPPVGVEEGTGEKASSMVASSTPWPAPPCCRPGGACGSGRRSSGAPQRAHPLGVPGVYSPHRGHCIATRTSPCHSFPTTYWETPSVWAGSAVMSRPSRPGMPLQDGRMRGFPPNVTLIASPVPADAEKIFAGDAPTLTSGCPARNETPSPLLRH